MRLYLQLERMSVARSWVAHLSLSVVHRPCSCHLDGLATTAFAVCKAHYPWSPDNGKLWLGEARQVVDPHQEKEEGGWRRKGTTVITLYTYIDMPREQLEDDSSGRTDATRTPKGVNYEDTVFQYLEAFKKRGGADHDTELEVVVVYRNGYQTFQCDGQQLNPKRDGWTLDQKLPTNSVDFHWMPHPKTGHQPSKAQTTVEASFYRPEVVPLQSRYKKHNPPPAP